MRYCHGPELSVCLARVGRLVDRQAVKQTLLSVRQSAIPPPAGYMGGYGNYGNRQDNFMSSNNLHGKVFGFTSLVLLV